MLPVATHWVLIVLTALPWPDIGVCTLEWPAPYSERTFFGYACRDDCALQKAGFRWAERHGIADPAACEVLADALGALEGCRAFAQEGLTPEDAGYAWALENEVAQPCRCAGAGEGFRAGCERYVTSP